MWVKLKGRESITMNASKPSKQMTFNADSVVNIPETNPYAMRQVKRLLEEGWAKKVTNKDVIAKELERQAKEREVAAQAERERFAEMRRADEMKIAGEAAAAAVMNEPRKRGPGRPRKHPIGS